MLWAAALIAGAIGYGLGSIPVGLIVGRLTRGIDVRDYGSGVTGATNVIRTSGWKAGVVVIIGDLAKGIAAVYLGLLVAKSLDVHPHDARAWAGAAGGYAAVLGHVWPVFAGFRGGRAVATGFGAALAMNPAAAAAMIPVAILVVLIFRVMSVMSITMAPALAILFLALAMLSVSPLAYALYAIAAAALIVYKHRPNIERLIAGTEPKIGRGGSKRSEAASEEGAPSPS